MSALTSRTVNLPDPATDYPAVVCDAVTRMVTASTRCQMCAEPVDDADASVHVTCIGDTRVVFRYRHHQCGPPQIEHVDAADSATVDDTAGGRIMAIPELFAATDTAALLVTPDMDQLAYVIDPDGTWHVHTRTLLAGHGWTPIRTEPAVGAGWARLSDGDVECVTVLGQVRVPVPTPWREAAAQAGEVVVVACADWPVTAGAGHGVDPAASTAMLLADGTAVTRVEVLA